MNVANDLASFDLVLLLFELVLIQEVYVEVFFFSHGLKNLGERRYAILSSLSAIRLLVVFAVFVARRLGLSVYPRATHIARFWSEVVYLLRHSL